MRVRRAFAVSIVFTVLISFAGTFFIGKEAVGHRYGAPGTVSLAPPPASSNNGEAFRDSCGSCHFLNSEKKTGGAPYAAFYFRTYTMQILRILIYTSVSTFGLYVFFKVILKRAP